MSRLISIESTGTQRNQQRRTIAEALRRLMEKRSLDAEAKDLAALIVFSLREIGHGVEQSASAWERKNYYLKADRFRSEWEWVMDSAEFLAAIIRTGRWHELPPVLAELAPRFADVQVTKYVKPASLWQGCYTRLMQEK